MAYYKQKQYVATVDNDDIITGKMDKWEAHKIGVLHRGYTAILTFENKYIFQHRKHPLFDGVFDFSFSSHQIYLNNNRLQNDTEAIYDGLKREWNINKSDLKNEAKFLKKIYYKAKDPNSDYTEHEIDYIYLIELKILPSPNYDFAYGFSLFERNKLKTKTYNLPTSVLAPWVKVMIEEKLI